MNKKIVVAVMNLFKSLPFDSEKNLNSNFTKENEKNISDYDTIAHGFLISSLAKQKVNNIKEYKNELYSLFGYNISDLNQSLHKSFQKIKDSTNEQLVVEQVCHYLTTYGFESVGIYNEKTVYIPNELLNISDVKGKPFALNLINAITIKEVVERVISMITSGVALSNDSINFIVDIIKELKIKNIDISLVKNKEIKSILYDYYNTVPENPLEFLRFVIYKTTNSALIIKNDERFLNIKRAVSEEKNKDIVNEMFDRYVKNFSLKTLASSFYRYKILWLALKNSHTSAYINKMRRLADKCKCPAKIGILDTLTLSSFEDSEDNISMLKKELKKVTIFKKISILNALSYRLSNPISIAYKIRNGKIFAKENSQNVLPSLKVYNIILLDIINCLKKNVVGKTIFIPENISYAFPTSEKMFIDNIPCGTSIAMDKNAIIGVHWLNYKNEIRTDLDLHCQSLEENEEYGWDSSYRSIDSDILFTGDMTSASPAKGGATEAFSFNSNVKDKAFLFSLFFFNNSSIGCDSLNTLKKEPLKYSLILDNYLNYSKNSKEKQITSSGIIHQSSMLSHVNLNLDAPANSIGMLLSDKEGTKKFVFGKFVLGNAITTSKNNDKKKNHLLNYLVESIKTQITLNDLLEKSGATLVRNIDDFNYSKNKAIDVIKQSVKEENKDDNLNKESINKLINIRILKEIESNFIDLSLEKICKDSILKLI